MLNKASIAILFTALVVSTLVAKTITASEEENLATTAPPIAWQREFTVGNGYSVFQLPDGGFTFNAANESAISLVKLDSSGNIESTKAIKIGLEPTVLPYFVPTSDGGYALAGVLGNMYVLAKTDSEANLLWTKAYRSNAPLTFMRSMIQTGDGGFALAGFGQIVDEGEGWIWFARTDASGNLLWNKTLSGPIADCPSTIIQEPDGGFMLSDVSFSLVPNQSYFRLIRTDQYGNVLWNQTYGDQGEYRIPECNTAIATNDGGYLIAGFLAGRNAWVVKTDANGKMLWNQTYGENNDAITCAHQTKDGGYIFAAVQNRTKAWIMKVDSTGNEAWNITFSGITFSGGLEANSNSVIQTSDSGYVVLGNKDENAWLAKLITPETNPLSLPQVQAAIVVVIIAIIAFVGFSLLKRRNKRKNLSIT